MPGFLVDQINVGPGFVDPADKKITDEQLFGAVPLEKSFGEKIGCEGVDDPACGDGRGKFSTLDGKIELVPGEEKLHIQMRRELEKSACIDPGEMSIIKLAARRFGSHCDVIVLVRFKEAGKHIEFVDAFRDKNIFFDLEIKGKKLIILDVSEKKLASLLEDIEQS